MLLEKPAFPVLVEIGEAEETVSHILESKGWGNYKFARVSIRYVPYYFFSYDIYDESSGKTKMLAKGRSALNAHTNEIARELSDIGAIQAESKSPEIKHDYHYEALAPKISERDAKEIILVVLSSEMGASRKNVIISGLELAFVPFWVLKYSIGEKNYSATMNAVTKKIISDGNIPGHEKTQQEIMAETYKELFDPGQWLHHASCAIGDLIDFFFPKGGKASSKKGGVLSNPDYRIILLAIIAIFVVLWVLYRL